MSGGYTIIDVIGASVAVAAFLFGVYQYREGRLEARRQFAASAIEKYRNSSCVAAAIQMLDWADRTVWLPPDADGDEGGKEYNITHSELAGALALINDRHNGEFTPQEVLLRDVFDGFIDELEHLANQERAGAFAIEDIAPYMVYLADLVFGHRPHLAPATRRALIAFINEYWGSHVVDFLKRCDDMSAVS